MCASCTVTLVALACSQPCLQLIILFSLRSLLSRVSLLSSWREIMSKSSVRTVWEGWDTWHSWRERNAGAPGVLQPGMHPVLLVHFLQVPGTGRILWNRRLVPVKAAAMGKWFKLKSKPIQISPWDKREGWNAAIWEQLLGLQGSKQSTRRCPKEGYLHWADLSNHMIYRDVGRYFLSHLKFNWAGPIPFIFRTNSSFKFHFLLDMAYALWKKGQILSVPCLLITRFLVNQMLLALLR